MYRCHSCYIIMHVYLYSTITHDKWWQNRTATESIVTYWDSGRDLLNSHGAYIIGKLILGRDTRTIQFEHIALDP